MEKRVKNDFFKRIRARIEDRDINVSLIALSIVVNTITAVFKVFFGFWIESVWVIMHAIYFIIMGIVRYRTMKRYIACKAIPAPAAKYNIEFEFHNRSGKFIFGIGLTYLMLCIRMYIVGDVVLIGGVLVYWFITFTFIKIAFAAYGLVVTRTCETPIVRVMKVIGTVDACLSVVPTLYASMSYFGSLEASRVSSVLGMLISGGVMISGIVMANRRRRREHEVPALGLLEK